MLSVEFDYEEGANGPHKPVLRDVRIENVTSESSGSVTIITAFPGAIIEGVVFENCMFRGVKSDDILKHTAAPAMQNVTVERVKGEKQ